MIAPEFVAVVLQSIAILAIVSLAEAGAPGISSDERSVDLSGA
jgi:hypothetical protein